MHLLWLSFKTSFTKVLKREGAPSCIKVTQITVSYLILSFVTDDLNEGFPAPWIGTGGSIPWPPPSPDFPPLDFFPWGYIKNIVYAEKLRNIQHLQERITLAIETVTQDIIQKMWQKIEFRLDVSRVTNGALI
jgi:hypothetical protein